MTYDFTAQRMPPKRTTPTSAPTHHGLSSSVSVAIDSSYGFFPPGVPPWVVVVAGLPPVDVAPPVVVAPAVPAAASFGAYVKWKFMSNEYTSGLAVTRLTLPTSGSSNIGSFLMLSTKFAIAFGFSPRPETDTFGPVRFMRSSQTRSGRSWLMRSITRTG